MMFTGFYHMFYVRDLSHQCIAIFKLPQYSLKNYRNS